MSDPTNQYPSIDQSPYGQAPQGAPQGTYGQAPYGVKHSRVRTASRRTARPSR